MTETASILTHTIRGINLEERGTSTWILSKSNLYQFWKLTGSRVEYKVPMLLEAAV